MRKRNLEQVLNALKNFRIEGKLRGCSPYGNGHINDTFRVLCELEDYSERSYILQTVNTNVFKKPEEVMKNIESVTDYLREVAASPREV